METKEEKNSKLIKQKLSLLKLKDKGISKIIIEFSGGGDSGDIDIVSFKDYNGEYIRTDKSYISIIEIFEDLGWKLIADKVDTVGDWVNNEGGWGEVIIDVVNSDYDLNYYQRTTEDFNWSACELFE